MAVHTSASLGTIDSPVAESEETFLVASNADTVFDLTPTTIKTIDSCYITPTNAAAVAAFPRIDALGAGKVTITCAVNSTYYVTLRGRRG